jgi:hypothetical protein
MSFSIHFLQPQRATEGEATSVKKKASLETQVSAMGKRHFYMRNLQINLS